MTAEADKVCSRALNRHRSSYALLLVLAAAALVAYHFPYLLRGGEPRAHSRQLLGLCFLAIAARPFLAPPEFRVLFLALSVIGCVVWGQLASLIMFGFAGLVIAISRSKIPMALRVTAVMLIWFGGIVPKLWLDRAQIVPHQPLFMYWACVPFGALYLVVERNRGVLEEATWLDDALYMLALPRFVSPFIQAISPSLFLRAQAEQAPNPKLALRGAGLLLYGILLYVLMAKFPYISPPRPDAQPDPRWGTPLSGLINLLFIYTFNASAIFCAVGLFRLMGFDLPSGFRWPFLSKSFADFYRRFNHYVYDSVMSLFMFPLLGRFRTFLPGVVAAVVAAYLAIFLGSYCLTQVLVPFAVDPNPRMVLRHIVTLDRLLLLTLFWTLIIVPQVVLQFLPSAGQPKLPPWIKGLGQRLVFWVLLLLLGALAAERGVVLL